MRTEKRMKCKQRQLRCRKRQAGNGHVMSCHDVYVRQCCSISRRFVTDIQLQEMLRLLTTRSHITVRDVVSEARPWMAGVQPTEGKRDNSAQFNIIRSPLMHV